MMVMTRILNIFVVVTIDIDIDMSTMIVMMLSVKLSVVIAISMLVTTYKQPSKTMMSRIHTLQGLIHVPSGNVA